MSQKCLHRCYICIPIISILLYLFTSTNFLIQFHLTDEADHGSLTTFTFPKITAKSDTYNVINPQYIMNKVDPVYLEKTVHDLSSFHTRHTESKFIDDAVYWLIKKLQNVCGTEIFIQNFTHTIEKTNYDSNDDDDNEVNNSNQPISYNLKNIACKKPGSTNNTIIVSAHYDSIMEDIKNNTARAPGADDNASGVSSLLEVARILSNVSLNHSIIFVLFSGEEQGKWGSTYYADYIDKSDVDLDLLINLDMIGFSSDGTNDFLVEYDNGNVVQDNDKYSQKIANFIKGLASNHTNLNATLVELGKADYLPFEALGYTVIGFHDDGVTKNPNHHTSADTPDTLNYEYLSSTTELVLATIMNLDKLITANNSDYAPSFLEKIQ